MAIDHPNVLIAAPSLKLLDQMRGVKEVLDSFEIPYETCIIAAHRAPKKTIKLMEEMDSKGIEVIIACGSGSAHLPGMMASLTTIPVIGVPLQSISLTGLDSLFSILQMPPGVPIGTMGINSAYNAGIYACQILSLKYPNLKQKLKLHKERMEQEVDLEDANLKKP